MSIKIRVPDFMRLNANLGELETEFRAHFLTSDLEQTRVAIGASIVGVAALGTIDYLVIGNSPAFFTHLEMRAAFILFSIFTAYWLMHVTNVKDFEWITIGWGLALVLLTVWVDYLRPADFIESTDLHLLMAFAGYVMLPLPPVKRMIIPVALTIGNLWVIFTVRDVPNAAWLGLTVSAFILMHIAGVVIALWMYHARREQFRAHHEQETINRQLRQLATTDDLTGIYNRRYFLERAQEEFERYQRHGHPFTLLIADLDLLKKINDTYGHHAGDLAIRQFAHLINKEKRATDIFGRLGGEEFGLLLPETTLQQAAGIINRIYDQKYLLVVRTVEEDVHFSFTAGVAECVPGYTKMEELFSTADQALYRGKDKGRDRVEMEFSKAR